MTIKKVVVALTALVVTTKLAVKRANRPRNFYFEYLSPRVVLVSGEVLDGASIPAKFGWATDIDEVWYCYSSSKEIQAEIRDKYEGNAIWTVPISLTLDKTMLYLMLVEKLKNLGINKKQILVITDAATLARLRRSSGYWSRSANDVYWYPVDRPMDSRQNYLAS